MRRFAVLTFAAALLASGAAHAQCTTSEVRDFQRALATLGYSPGPADGKIGRRTREAIKRWQRDKGERATGKLECEFRRAAPSTSGLTTGTIAFHGEYSGGLRAGKPHGYGEWTNDDDHRYEGEWRDGLKHGQGIYTWPDGSEYAGEYRNGDRHGQGHFEDSKGVYDGEWQGGVRHGEGTLVWTDGTRYEGKWSNDVAHGYGVYTRHGETHRGTWTNGCFKDGDYRAWIGRKDEECP